MSHMFSTKAETLSLLQKKGFSIPPLLYFEVQSWKDTPEKILHTIFGSFSNTLLAIRSSSQNEDTYNTSMAGAFKSILHVPCERDPLQYAINSVAACFQNNSDQILVQSMVHNVQMSGVIMTRTLHDGSPYYVFNYDDSSGRTDTVTSGTLTAKTVYIYHGVTDNDFDSLRLRNTLTVVRSLEKIYTTTPLDIEFAIDTSGRVWLLQVRPIATAHNWNLEHTKSVSEHIRHVESFIQAACYPQPGLYGKRTIYGVMPDWNPAEIIGFVPRPLAFSLYRELITNRIWRDARKNMGYHSVPIADLMVSIAGHPYIDVRASVNSFLPAGLSPTIAEKLTNAWLDRLDEHPEFHDTIEFDIVHTVLDVDCMSSLSQKYPGLLTNHEQKQYITALQTLTNLAIQQGGTVHNALQNITDLHATPLLFPEITSHPSNACTSATEIILSLPLLLEECRQLGTLPFAIIARHAFMAESLLRSLVRCGALEQTRLDEYKRSIETISGRLNTDFANAYQHPTKRKEFLEYYGHLRPGTYDILSLSYRQRPDLFEGITPLESAIQTNTTRTHPFILREQEKIAINTLLKTSKLHITAEQLCTYAYTAIAGREYAKFVFTRHLSHILELLAAWGTYLGLTREQVAMIPIDAILALLFSPLPTDIQTHFLHCIEQQQQLYTIATSFKLSQLIRSPRDVYIAPMHRSIPTFITSRRIEAPITYLSMDSIHPILTGRIVCIESADPGYDWIFTRPIAGLITCFGGSNSHLAIRCAEYGLPAAIGCGLALFQRITTASSCILDCSSHTLQPIT